MTIIETARKVTTDKSAQLVREHKKELRRYDVKPLFTGSHRGWFILDLFTASAICAVADAINQENLAKFQELALPKVLKITWSLVKTQKV